MATPLRKDQPPFEDEEITTADLAQGKRPVAEVRGPQPVAAERVVQPATTNQATPLFPSEELEGLRTRWKEIQTAFVDEPRTAVQQADGLVASAMKRLAEVFAEERSGLERQWDQGDSVSTEDLRVALQRYRAFFDRLLSV
jgi:hypothetical protein